MNDEDLRTAEHPGDDLHMGQLCHLEQGHEGDHKTLAEVGPGWRRWLTWSSR